MDQNSISSIAKYIGIGYHLVAPLLIGVFLGLFIDKYFKTQPIFTIIGIIIGVFIIFYNLINLDKDK